MMKDDNRREIAAEFFGSLQRAFARAADRFALETETTVPRLVMVGLLFAAAAQCGRRRDELAPELHGDDHTTLN